MSRARKPTALLELTGALRKDPQRYRDRANEPRPDTSIGEPPADFIRTLRFLAGRSALAYLARVHC